jgi:hypothetical protein
MEQTLRAAAAQAKGKAVESCQGGIFVPTQESGETLPPSEALDAGTAFPCLVSPYGKWENKDG